MAQSHPPLPSMLLALAAFALFSIGDAIVRSMAGQWPGSAIAFVRYGTAAIGLAIFAAIRLGRAGFAMPAPVIQIGRGASIAGVGATFWVSLSYMPLADATAIQFSSPVWAALFSTVFLKEAMGWRQMVLVLIAFAGTMIVLQPNVAAFGTPALLPLGTALCLASLLLCNRALGSRGTVTGNQFWLAAIATIFMIPIVLAGHVSEIPQLVVTRPSAAVILKCLFIALTSTIGHAMLYRATLRASAATVAPMTYIQIVFAILLGWLLFASPPQPSMLLGGATIIVAGWLLIRLNMRMARVVGETGTASN